MDQTVLLQLMQMTQTKTPPARPKTDERAGKFRELLEAVAKETAGTRKLGGEKPKAGQSVQETAEAETSEDSAKKEDPELIYAAIPLPVLPSENQLPLELPTEGSEAATDPVTMAAPVTATVLPEQTEQQPELSQPKGDQPSTPSEAANAASAPTGDPTRTQQKETPPEASTGQAAPITGTAQETQAPEATSAAQTPQTQTEAIPATQSAREVPDTAMIAAVHTDTETKAVDETAAETRPEGKAEAVAPPVEREQATSTPLPQTDRFTEMVQEAARQLDPSAATEEQTDPEGVTVQTTQPEDTQAEASPRKGSQIEAKPEPEILRQPSGKVIIRPETSSASETVRRSEPAKSLKEQAPAYETISAAIEKLNPREAGAVEATPKAAEAPRAPQAEQIRVAIAERLSENGEQERIEFEMELHPRELGRIDVRMVLEGGKLAVEIIAATPKTEQLLRSQMDGLAASLRVSSAQELPSVQVVASSSEAPGYLGSALDLNYHSPGSEQQQARQGGTGTANHTATDSIAADETDEAETPTRLLNRAV